MRVAALAALLLIAAPGPASAMQRARIPQLPGPLPALIHEPCPGYHPAPRGCAISPGDVDATGRQWSNGAVFVRPGTGRYVLLHELGHIYDDRYFDNSERRAFARAIHRTGHPWRVIWRTPAGPVQSPDSLAEIMADAYANCRMRHDRKQLRSAWATDFDYFPTQSENTRACRVIINAADHGDGTTR